MRDRVILIRHDDGPDDDRALAFFRTNGFKAEIVRPFAGEALPALDETIHGSIIYGGPFNVFDTELHPFLREEYRWIEASLAADRPLLGICQGAQQIAWHFGARVGPADAGHQEFGCYRIDPAPDAGEFLPQPIWVTQNHYHTFDIPHGATRLASSALFENQAFRIGRNVYALQFHPEVSRATFGRWQARDGAYQRPGVQPQAEQNSLLDQHFEMQGLWFDTLLRKLFGRLS